MYIWVGLFSYQKPNACITDFVFEIKVGVDKMYGMSLTDMFITGMAAWTLTCVRK